MKPTRFLFLFLAALVPWTLQAQTEVPERISYQGIITDVTGKLVGTAANGVDPAPVNRNVIFRIWDHQTNSNSGNLLYSEQTVATISKGEFSVLVGGGAQVTSQQFGFSEASKGPGPGKLAAALAGSSRYLGVTVDDGTGAPDLEITPRQQIVTTAFSFRAKVAENVGGVLSLNGDTVNMTKGFTANATSTVNGLLDVDDIDVDNGVLGVNRTTDTVIIGGTLDANGALDVDGFTNLDGFSSAANSSVTGTFTVSSTLDANGALDVDGFTDLDGFDSVGNSSVSGVLTVTNGSSGQPNDDNAGIIIEDESFTYLQFKAPDNSYAGLVFGQNNYHQHGGLFYRKDHGMQFRTGGSGFDMTIDETGEVNIPGNLDVGGTTNLDGFSSSDNGSITGTLTVSSTIDANGNLDVDGTTNLDGFSSVGDSSVTGDLDVSGDLNVSGSINVSGASPRHKLTISGDRTVWREITAFNVEEWLGDEDGGRIRVLLINRSTKQLRNVTLDVYMDNDVQFNQEAGTRCHIVDNYGRDFDVNLATSGQVAMYNVHDWFWIHNYNNPNVPANAVAGPAYANGYDFEFLVAPNIIATIYISD